MLNLRLFHSSLNPRNHFSTVLIKTNWYTISCKYHDCSGLTSVTIPNSVTTIRDLTFGGCSGLTSVTILNSVTSIGNSAFYGCSGLTSVNILGSVTEIGKGAFAECGSLTRIEAYPDPVNVSLGPNVFLNVPKDETLHVLPQYLETYQTADQWNEFTNIAGDLVEPTTAGDVNGDGKVNVSDVSALINMILGITPMDQTTSDVNGDGRVNVSDVSALINIILGIL